METALIGLLGVLVGTFFTVIAGYFMDRRKAWTSARAGGLQLLAELETVVADLRAGATPPDLGVAAWAQYREALLFRQGNFPSGINSKQWLTLARCFNRLRVPLDESNRERALVELEAALQTLEVFVPDKPAFSTFMRRTVARVTRRG